jgi:succinate dehydrogenase / fumarate reductase membrane anchor subunit
MSYQTDRQRVIGLGTAHEGTGHWWGQRLTAVALIPLVPLFVFPFARALGDDFAAVRAIYAHPFNAIVAILLILVAFRHLQQGLQVIVEDYVPGAAARSALLVANSLLTWALALAGVFAVARIAFAG